MDKINFWTEFLQPYKQAVEELKIKIKSIRTQFRERSEYSPIEFVTGRVKTISSIIEKADKLGIDRNDLMSKMEDIAGIRVMCQFKDDIYSVVNLLKNRNLIDFEIVLEKDYIHNPKESGYKSYHLIIKYPVHTAYGNFDILAEIQIRTLAMNFWATIEHSLNYKYQEHLPENIKHRLKNAAIAATKLDEEMYEIRKEIVSAQILFEGRSNTVHKIIKTLEILRNKGKESDALIFERKFDKLDKNDIEPLEALLIEMKEILKQE